MTSIQLSQKCIIINSNKAPPYFRIEHRKLKVTDNDILVKVLYFSVDPVMKVFLAGAKTYFNKVIPGDICNCFGLGKIIQGNQFYQLNSYVFGNIGTCDINILDQQRQKSVFPVPIQLVQKYGQSQFVYLINNGLAAYAGYQILQPKPGDTVVVSTASGATGLLLCQLLKKKQCKIIGLTSPHKFQIIKQYTDITVDYKDKLKLEQVLKNNKFTCYFDNVGDNLLDLILNHIQIGGKIALCGTIANYTNYHNRGIENILMITNKRLQLKGLAFMSKISQAHHIFQQYQGIQLKIINISMEEFQYYFTELLKSGNKILGKVIVKI